MDLTWITVQCPIYGWLRGEMMDLIRSVADPWQTYAVALLTAERVSSAQTVVVIGMQASGQIVASAWVSLPDQELVGHIAKFAYLFNVYVEPQFRNCGFGRRAVTLACRTARDYGAPDILLATNVPGIRERVYSPLGFRSMAPDPWLMVRDSGVPPQRSHILRTHSILRSVCPHDLATIQTICAQTHWLCEGDSVIRERPQECEEEFCTMCSANSTSQFLFRGRQGGQDVVAWLALDGINWSQRLVCGTGQPIVARVLARRLRELVTVAPKPATNSSYIMFERRLSLE